MMRSNKSTPYNVIETLHRFADRISIARKARSLRQDDLASMAGISRSTLVEIEKGSPHVAIGNYMGVLWAMNLVDQMDEVARPENDEDAVAIMASNLPRRVRP